MTIRAGCDRRQPGASSSKPRIYRGRPAKAGHLTVSQPGQGKGRETRVCPTCGLQVKVKKDGSLGSHTIGYSGPGRKYSSWPCKGEDNGTL